MRDAKITVFKNLLSVDVPYIITLEKAVKRIKEGASKELLSKIRSIPKKTERDVYKAKLPAIIFSGEFSERKKDGLINHSGLMITDYDGFSTEEEMRKFFNEVKSIKHVVLCFVSPSGKQSWGFKALVRIPKCNAKEHSAYFKKFKEDFEIENWDKSNSDVSRICYESYDPEIYVNYDAEIYEPTIIDEGYSVSEKVPLLPINDEDVIIEKIMKWNWNKDFIEGERNSFIFDLAGAFCEYGVSESTAFGYIQNNVVYGDFSERETKNTVKSAYKIRSFGIKFFEDYNKRDQIKTDLNRGKKAVLEKYKIEDDVYDQIKIDVEHEDFWYYEEDSKGNEKIKINPLSYKLFLERNGFKKYFPEDSLIPSFVRIKSNKVKMTSTEIIKDFVLDYLLENKKMDVWSYCASYHNLFSENFLSMLETIELLMLKDKKYESYIAFNNGILKVSGSNVQLIDYIDVDGYIWESQIINRDFELKKETNNEYKKFINNISNNNPDAIECVIGFLLSTYKNKMNNKAVILNDEVISENPEGGTGKGLFIQGLRQIRKVSILDGKTFDEKKSFPYQTVSQETQILVFDDVKKNWDFESKFSLVTEGMTLERKNKDAIKLSVEDSPKMVISTNYAIKGEGNSHERRRHEIEVAQYYGSRLTPYDEFGRQLFDDWDEEEFNDFDNYMVQCLQKYFRMGLVPQVNAKNLDKRKFIAETSMEFHEWITDTTNFSLNTRHNKADKFNQFTEDYPDYKKYLSRKRFQIWVQKYAGFIGKEFQDGTNPNRWFGISEEGYDLRIRKDDDDLPF